jgi:hypothetical protein
LELGSDLRAELARRHDYQRERRSARCRAVDPLEDREGEGAGLAGAGLRLREEIAAGAKVRDRKVLDRREGRPTEVTRRAIKVWSKSDQVRRGPSLGYKKSGPRDAARHMTLLGPDCVGISIPFRSLKDGTCLS